MPPRAKVVSAISWEEKQEQLKKIQSMLEDKNVWTAFCDGSSIQNPGPAGAAALLVLNSDNKSETKSKTESKIYVSPTKATNNQMELKGLDLALDLLSSQQTMLDPKDAKNQKEPKDTKDRRKKWVVFTDSDYVCGLFERGHTAHKNADLVQSLKNRLTKLSAKFGVEIRIQWVRAHCGIEFNEQVDKLSREAAKQSPSKPQHMSYSPSGPTSAPAASNGSGPREIRLNRVHKKSIMHQPSGSLKRRTNFKDDGNPIKKRSLIIIKD